MTASTLVNHVEKSENTTKKCHVEESSVAEHMWEFDLIIDFDKCKKPKAVNSNRQVNADSNGLLVMSFALRCDSRGYETPRVGPIQVYRERGGATHIHGISCVRLIINHERPQHNDQV